MAFTEKLSKEALEYFSMVCQKPFAEQAVAFLNAYWAEVGIKRILFLAALGKP